MTILYFAYGSNLSTDKLAKWEIDAEIVSTACLHDWQFVMNKRGKDGSAKANIESRQGEMVWGVVYGIAKSDIDRLDKYESLGRGYRADYLDVVTPDKKTISAYTYIGIKLKEGLLPHAWYSDYILNGAQEHRLPIEYITRLKNILTA